MTSARLCCVSSSPRLVCNAASKRSFCLIISLSCLPAHCPGLWGHKHRGHFLSFWNFLRSPCGLRAAGRGTVAGESRGLDGLWMWMDKDVSGHGELVYSGGRFFAVDYSQWMFIELLLCGRPCAKPWGTREWCGHRFCPHGVHSPVGKFIYN